ncbi:hypothetical protein [Chromobacterium sp. IIBBL 290-4]|uniref:hypothetical protein n=1 Tax=Chromobacterium sp. IIBBL 290-4 TaxID=2953890 RepID=UPI0020B6DB1F|nr:hypothetical protein [Chromobacterium sp. IIBBL 290-4]UTH76202.1 hypothetical protein NKT35_08910 [Chromobacterium sp. IIBBL 290-4]
MGLQERSISIGPWIKIAILLLMRHFVEQAYLNQKMIILVIIGLLGQEITYQVIRMLWETVVIGVNLAVVAVLVIPMKRLVAAHLAVLAVAAGMQGQKARLPLGETRWCSI